MEKSTSRKSAKPEQFAVHEGQTDKIVMFVSATVEALSKYCTPNYAFFILRLHKSGLLTGIHLTPTGRLRATRNEI